ncbi:MAG: hypothetical protein NC302_03345 [Bacteroidales bacterium]|nr:hypothetical protein [Bacteroidales bacterium]MCM1415042.1 hypothetical protein [bacterium]MCM1422896.1 hypothetical protein [bacterium]
MYQKNAARRHWWQDAGLMTRELPAKEREPFFLLVDCPVPPYYYKRQPWQPDVLSACMTDAVHGARGMVDAWLHPEIMTLMSENYRRRWETAPDTAGRLLACLLAVSAADRIRESGEAAVLLGKPSDTLWQIEMTGKILAPYLPRINRLAFFYEETEGVDLWEEAADSLETYSYEYGITPALVPYRTNGGKTAGAGNRQAGGRVGSGLILDLGAPVDGCRLQGVERAVYVDLTGSAAKERKCLAKSGRILYVSPLKYLDTAVKSEYDRTM